MNEIIDTEKQGTVSITVPHPVALQVEKTKPAKNMKRIPIKSNTIRKILAISLRKLFSSTSDSKT